MVKLPKFWIAPPVLSAVLLLNYAVVMEDPGHELSAQPRFQLNVLNGTRKLTHHYNEYPE